MSKNSGLMDTEPGGEQTQYEGQSTFISPKNKSEGQLGGSSTSSTQMADGSPSKEEKEERGEKTAENIRYGEAISEHGFGGETTGNSGEAGQEGGYGGTEARDEDLQQTRREQGYGGGNDVGA